MFESAPKFRGVLWPIRYENFDPPLRGQTFKSERFV
jgi:hypothetical protein